MLITVSRNNTKRERMFARSLANLFNLPYISRGKHSLHSLQDISEKRAYEKILIVSKTSLSFVKNLDFLAIFNYTLLQNSPIKEKFLEIKNNSKDNSFSQFFSFQKDATLSLNKEKEIFFFINNTKTLPLKFKLKKCD